MGKTKNGIYYDLSETEYFTTVDLPDGADPLTFYFSSPINLRKFQSRLADRVEEARAYVLQKFRVEDRSLYSLFLGAIAAYTMTERRGFRMEWGGVDYWRVESITLPGQLPRTTG